MGPELDRLIDAEQFALPATRKGPALLAGLDELTRHHLGSCQEYARMLAATGADVAADSLDTVPYLPAALFKSLELRSVPLEGVFKVMTSSGTSSQVPSRIFLDVETARLQTRALSAIVTHYLGHQRRPMLIVDHADILRDRRRFSARAAAILGMLTYGRDHHYALDAGMALDRPSLEAWLARHADEDLLVFGFTFMVWQHLLVPLRDAGLDLSRATLVHAGGWKKLADLAVSRAGFRTALRTAFGIERVHDFYGMVEQVGSVFFECPAGFYHPPDFADVLVRDPRTWEPAPLGEPGVIEVLSLLPRSYPGHALLTEDLGVIHGEDDCPCGRMGRRFEVEGRVPAAEIRGCSDTREGR